ncbi:MAG: hypothetical protein V2B19_09785 [Pseudomonadota bacterium]
MGTKGNTALIMVSATPGYFFQPGKNSLSLKQLAGLPKTPWRDLLATRVGRIDDQGRKYHDRGTRIVRGNSHEFA